MADSPQLRVICCISGVNRGGGRGGGMGRRGEGRKKISDSSTLLFTQLFAVMTLMEE